MASQESLKESAWARLEELRPSLEEHAQGHLLQFAAELGEAERGALADELASLDVGKIVKVFKASMAGGAGESKKDDRLEPLEPSICGSTLRDESRVAGWEEAGLEEIGRGKVGGAGAVQQWEGRAHHRTPSVVLWRSGCSWRRGPCTKVCCPAPRWQHCCWPAAKARVWVCRTPRACTTWVSLRGSPFTSCRQSGSSSCSS